MSKMYLIAPDVLRFLTLTATARFLCLGFLLLACTPIRVSAQSVTVVDAPSTAFDARVVEQGQDFTTYEVSNVDRDEQGREVRRTSRFTLVENGLNYLVDGHYVP